MPAVLPSTPAAARPAGDLPEPLLRRWRKQLLRAAAVTAVLCLAIALVLTATDGRGFVAKLVYSMCIGLVCMMLVMVTRLLATALAARWRATRGLAEEPSEARAGWRGVIPGCIVAVLVGPPVGMWMGDQITGQSSPSLLSWAPASRLTMAYSLIATVAAVAVLSALERLASARAQAEAAQRQAAENQLRLLQSQLEPHMLFNTLANLRVLIGIDPSRAQAMLDHLIAFLRATLAASRHATHPLSTEFQHLADYLALMAMRLGPRLSMSLDLPKDLRSVQVPPLLLQPLVENAVKHGLEPKVEGGRLAVSARQEGATLVLTVRDTGVGLSAAPATGGTSFGLEQVRSRLATLYGDRAGLTLADAQDADGGAVATLHLPLPQPQPSPAP